MFIGAFKAFGEVKSAETVETHRGKLRDLQSEINALNKQQCKLRRDIEEYTWMRNSATRSLDEVSYEVNADTSNMTNEEIADILLTRERAQLYVRYDDVYISYRSDTPDPTVVASVNRQVQTYTDRIERAERQIEENRQHLAQLHAEHTKVRQVLGEMQRCFNVLFRSQK